MLLLHMMRASTSSWRDPFQRLRHPVYLQHVATRTRATYYQKPSKMWTPRWLRRFNLRHPRWPLYALTVVFVVPFFIPPVFHLMMKLTMAPDEWEIYMEEQKNISRSRAIAGKDLWFPWSDKPLFARSVALKKAAEEREMLAKGQEDV